MRNRIRNILILMSACIIGIFAFQGYWLYQAYQIRLQEFNRDINDALRTAVFNKQSNDAEKILGIRTRAFRTDSTDTADDMSAVMNEPAIPAAHGQKSYFFRKSITFHNSDSAEAVGQLIENNNGKVQMTMVSADTTVKLFADSISRRISNILVMNRFFRNSFNLHTLDSVYGRELIQRGISTAYSLDTLKIPQTGQMAINRPSSLLQTTIIPFNPMNDVFVSATFKSPLALILGKMIWSLSGSALLLVLTVLCFVYMLRTILRQKRLSEVKNDFINNMTHELKTPIATVSAAVEALQHFNALHDENKTKQYLSISRNELTRLNDLVEKVLHIAAEEKEDMELSLEITDINALISNIITNHRLKSGKKADFTYTLLADAQAMVDPAHLANAINNLVDNAIKYSPEPAEIVIHVTRQQERLRITVKDNGIGIPHNYQDSIFEKFFRVPTGNIHNVKGFGLGLSYVKKIVEKHGGWIKVKSEPEKGSEFLLEIPLT